MLMGILRGWCEADYKNQNTWAMAGTFTAGHYTQRGYGVFVNGAVVEVCPPTAEGMEQACEAVRKEAQKYANPRVITDVAVYSHVALVTAAVSLSTLLSFRSNHRAANKSAAQPKKEAAMAEYQVSWTVDIDAENPQQAAQAVASLYFQKRIARGEPDSACVFKVREREQEEWAEVDLSTILALECAHADTCLSCYWGGHHLPHVQAVVHNGITFEELKQQLRSELNIGVVMGADYDESDERWHRAALAAVDAMTLREGADPEHLFKDLETDPEEDDDGDEVWAYFVFREVQ